MKSPIRKERYRLYLWIALGYLFLWLFADLLSNPATFFKKAVNNIWLTSYLVVLNYILFEYTIPFIRLKWKRLLLAPFLLFFHLLLYSFGLYAWRLIGIGISIYFELKVHESMLKGIEYHMPYSFFSIIFFGVIRYTYDLRKLKEDAQRLRMEKQEAELNYLKSQTNPHFLFNTLNNIYALAREKSDLAPESILRLSKILRFMLYDAGADYTTIEQELRIITDYIELEKLRYDETLEIRFYQDIEDHKQAIPPLLLIPLVENAFKHGISETRNRPWLEINLSLNRKLLVFTVKNSLENSGSAVPVKENIGISNLRRQLELLYTDYSLTVDPNPTEFIANLKINLASHV